MNIRSLVFLSLILGANTSAYALDVTKEICVDALTKLGIAAEGYELKKGWGSTKHLFSGRTECYERDDSIYIKSGGVIFAKDGFFGLEALSARDKINQIKRDKRKAMKEEMNQKIRVLRDEFKVAEAELNNDAEMQLALVRDDNIPDSIRQSIKADEEQKEIKKKEADKRRAERKAEKERRAKEREAERAAEQAKAKAEEEVEASAKAEKERIVNDFKAANEDPWFRTTGVVTSDYIVDVSIETNIPFDFESGLSIDLAGQAGDETYIGTGLIRVPVTNGSASVTIDVRDHWDHSIPFPRGTFELEGYFYNQWKENIEIVELLEIYEKVGTVSEVTFVGSGESPEKMRTHLSRSSWVMLNVSTGEPLSDRIFSNLPDLQITGREKRNASVDFVHWYSASADITIIVNSFTKEIVTWVKGRKEGD